MNRSRHFSSPHSRPLPPTRLQTVYRTLRAHFGHQRWWPGDTPFEIMIGAILTQNTAWTNVEKAIQNLKRAHALDPHTMMRLPVKKLASLIRPAGYFNVKAKRLRNFLKYYLTHYGGSHRKIRSKKLDRLRRELLAVNGIGKETADSILLYALEKPVFVIDAYTKRIFSRHRMVRPSARRPKPSPGKSSEPEYGYDEWQGLFQQNIPRNVRLFNDFHAQIVAVGKNFCRPKNPDCASCPLRIYL
jgi:endonuclease-3 related protein